MRHERFWIYTIFLIAVACSRETPAPATNGAATSATNTATTTTQATTDKPWTTTDASAVPRGGSYDEAMLWLTSAPKFHFVLDENGVHAEGNLTRRTVGLETVQFTANGDEWRATSGPQGVTWERRKGTKWTADAAPAYGNRLYQRVTLAFDPKKKEGAPQLVGTEGAAKHYRFTNANTGEVHEVWVNTSDNHVERMKIGEGVELKLKIEN